MWNNRRRIRDRFVGGAIRREAKMGSRNAPRQSLNARQKQHHRGIRRTSTVRTSKGLHASFVCRLSIMLLPGSLVMFVNYRYMFAETSSKRNAASANCRCDAAPPEPRGRSWSLKRFCLERSIRAQANQKGCE